MTVLAEKVAIVTGASSGIGYATAKLFAREGAKVVVTARRQAMLDSLVAEIEEREGHAIAVAGDVRDEALAKALVDAAIGRFGGLGRVELHHRYRALGRRRRVDQPDLSGLHVPVPHDRTGTAPEPASCGAPGQAMSDRHPNADRIR